ncbi:XerD Site-specific recombinase XerD [Candidatus Methylopumilus universalis]|uniref:site-specific integrase n=1 Tax=Candidatus Methylopumilus universalis TaxID=2588536 RepID=UPI003BEF0D81
MNDTARNCLQATIKKIEGAYAPATIRAYKSNFENFIKFCDENNTSALPASSEIIASYIKKLSSHLKSSSIKIAVASIAALHNLNSLSDPTQTPDVKIEMRRMYRTLGRYAKQAYGVNKDLLDKMVAATDDSLRGVRDKAILLVAYDSLCRRSEIVSLEYEDLMIDDKDGSVKLKLRKSKTDPHGIGKNLYLSNESKQALKEWINKSKISSGKIFRAITTTEKIKGSLNSSHIGRIYKKIAARSNVDINIIKNISSHSMRVGAAQDLITNGSSLSTIMNRGRWTKTDTVMRYIENINYR